jgi:cytochrome c oxidase subunit 2
MNWSWILPEGFSTVSGDIDALYYVILWITGIVFFATEGLLLYLIFKYRHKEGRQAAHDHGSTKMEIAWTLVPLVIVVGIGIASKGVWDTVKVDVPSGGYEIIVTARQFEWLVTYPGPDGALGTADDFETLNEMHVAEDRPVVITLRSDDVLHSLFLPQMRIKQDAIPGRDITVWFEAVQPGDYDIGCAELCGTGHTTMNGALTVYTAADFAVWAATQAQQQQQQPQP